MNRARAVITTTFAVIFFAAAATQVDAQRRTTAAEQANPFEDQPQAPPPPLIQIRPDQVGRVSDSAVGEAGQRQTRDQTQGIAPTARLSSRIQNRVQSRIRNRLDRYYDPQANATSPFVVAQDQVRAAGRPRR